MHFIKSAATFPLLHALTQTSQGTERPGRQGKQLQTCRSTDGLIRGQQVAPDRNDQRPPFFAGFRVAQGRVIDDDVCRRVGEFFQDLKRNL